MALDRAGSDANRRGRSRDRSARSDVGREHVDLALGRFWREAASPVPVSHAGSSRLTRFVRPTIAV